MATILRRSKEAIMGHGGAGRPKPDGRCKKHPKHRQCPGVCSLCLRERLSRLNNMNPNSRRISTTTGSSGSSTTSSLSSYYSSESESECSSPMQYCRYRYGGNSSSVSFLFSGNNVLKKSRSLAFVTRKEVVRSENKRSAGGGFWSKLIHPRNNNSNKRRDQETRFMHSRTVRERSVLPQMVH